MTAEQLYNTARAFLSDSEANRVPPDRAIRPECAGMEIFADPLMGFALADDPYFQALAATPEANVPLMPPGRWLPTACTVVSVFLPFTPGVRESNRADMRYPSDEWLHARIEGQGCVDALCRHLADTLQAAGADAVAPSLDGRFRQQGFSSNWSERHVAYACGLGTFSLSRGLITEGGAAGRIGSLVTSLALPPTPRRYSGLADYCTLCGVCARNCPAGAIDRETGKDHEKCKDFLDRVRSERAPYYGCGKCQVGVPCEVGIPPGAGA